jgi:hypothetical protein
MLASIAFNKPAAVTAAPASQYAPKLPADQSAAVAVAVKHTSLLQSALATR